MSVRSWALLLTALSLTMSTQAVQVARAGTAATPRVVSSAGAATWGPVHRFERDPRGQSVTVGPHDVVTVAWGSQRGWPERVKVAQRTSDGRWRAPVTLGVGYAPVVASDAGGDLTVTWCRDRAGWTTGVWVARKPAGGPWTRPVHVSTDRAAPGYPDGASTYGATGLDIATSPSGATLVTWRSGSWDREVPFRVDVVYRTGSGAWGRVQTLTNGPGQAIDVHAVVARDGTASVAYTWAPTRGRERVVVRSRAASGWRPAERVALGAVGAIGVRADGVLFVALLSRGRVLVAHRGAAGTWAPPDAVTPPDLRVQDWAAAISARGAVLVTYLVRPDRVDAVRRAPGGRWSGPTTLVVPEHQPAGVVAGVDARGDLFAGWHDNYGIWGRYQAAGRGWQATTTVQADVGQVDVLEDLAVQVTPSGDVALLWEQEERPLRMRVLSDR
ncbi:hypothetical protein [Nocardioides sp.]|uniref:hypothetical protein n=1 Tax=Nocardioides sp. TaxID=35761 RepID=UPI003783BFB1